LRVIAIRLMGRRGGEQPAKNSVPRDRNAAQSATDDMAVCGSTLETFDPCIVADGR